MGVKELGKGVGIRIGITRRNRSKGICTHMTSRQDFTIPPIYGLGTVSSVRLSYGKWCGFGAEVETCFEKFEKIARISEYLVLISE